MTTQGRGHFDPTTVGVLFHSEFLSKRKAVLKAKMTFNTAPPIIFQLNIIAPTAKEKESSNFFSNDSFHI